MVKTIQVSESSILDIWIWYYDMVSYGGYVGFSGIWVVQSIGFLIFPTIGGGVRLGHPHSPVPLASRLGQAPHKSTGSSACFTSQLDHLFGTKHPRTDPERSWPASEFSALYSCTAPLPKQLHDSGEIHQTSLDDLRLSMDYLYLLRSILDL